MTIITAANLWGIGTKLFSCKITMGSVGFLRTFGVG